MATKVRFCVRSESRYLSLGLKGEFGVGLVQGGTVRESVESVNVGMVEVERVDVSVVESVGVETEESVDDEKVESVGVGSVDAGRVDWDKLATAKAEVTGTERDGCGVGWEGGVYAGRAG